MTGAIFDRQFSPKDFVAHWASIKISWIFKNIMVQLFFKQWAPVLCCLYPAIILLCSAVKLCIFHKFQQFKVTKIGNLTYALVLRANILLRSNTGPAKCHLHVIADDASQGLESEKRHIQCPSNVHHCTFVEDPNCSTNLNSHEAHTPAQSQRFYVQLIRSHIHEWLLG